jgi:adenosylcobinamide amidohydrolase
MARAAKKKIKDSELGKAVEKGIRKAVKAALKKKKVSK